MDYHVARKPREMESRSGEASSSAFVSYSLAQRPSDGLESCHLTEAEQQVRWLATSSKIWVRISIGTKIYLFAVMHCL
jgi:hypothetical protein